MFRRVVPTALLLLLPALAFAQAPVVKSNVVTKSVTITAIDPATRLVTFKTADGQVDSVVAGPAVARFNELKVGDTVTFRYAESLVFELKKAGSPAAPGSAAVEVARGGKTPGGGVAQQLTTTVTVVSVDEAASTITVKTEDNRVVTRKVQEKKNLAGVTAGDKIEITYTEALLASVDPPK